MPVLLYLLAVAVFAQGTSEFVLAGLLPGISADLGVSVAQAGSLTSAFAVGMVVGAPSMAALGRRLSPRWTLTGFLSLFIGMHLLGAMTGNFAVLFATRTVSALANAGFLAVTLSTVAEIVPAHRRARALAVVLGGTTLALVAGVPAGAFIGSVLSWRVALVAIAVISVPALVAVLIATPTRPRTVESPRPLGRLSAELHTLRSAPLRLVLLLAVAVNAGTFCTFTYLAPISTDQAGLRQDHVPLVLAVFGIGAFIGVSTAGRLADRHWRRILTVGGACLLAGWLLFALLVTVPLALWALALVQGALSFAVGSTLIARIMATAQDAPTMAGSFATVALNLGAVAGPVLGGVALDLSGPRGPLLTSAALVLVALLARTSSAEASERPRRWKRRRKEWFAR